MALTEVDVVVIGGGIAALWLLDALDERGFAAILIEPGALGQGQTLASQGIIHGGLKYTLRGLLHPSAEAVSAMPERWRRSLAGSERPDLRAAVVRSPSTWMWRSESLRSKLGMLGARAGLRTVPIEVADAERPAILRSAPGTVYRVDEPVLETRTLVEAFLARHEERMIATPGAASIELSSAALDHRLSITTANGPLTIRARAVVLAAGSLNQTLRERFGLPIGVMQRRPLHMTMVRGQLPELHGHCVDGAATRVTVTTAGDRDGRNVWQLGGQLAEEGVALESAALIAKARSELRQVLPDFRQEAADGSAPIEWATYRIDRAELATRGTVRPDDAQCLADGPRGLMTLWPTKLALAPRGAELVLAALDAAQVRPRGSVTVDGPRPTVGLPPWESASWTRSAEGTRR
jgi:glycerol-3-phosphate dehydrogenase